MINVSPTAASKINERSRKKAIWHAACGFRGRRRLFGLSVWPDDRGSAARATVYSRTASNSSLTPSHQLPEGREVDFVDTVTGGGFTIRIQTHVDLRLRFVVQRRGRSAAHSH